MSEVKWTKGPLNFHATYGPANEEPTVCENFTAQSITIAKDDCILGEATYFKYNEGYDGGHPRTDTFEEAKANAQLWIAAPDLYAALISARMYINPSLRPAPDAVYGQIEAALARARGEQS